MKVAIMCPICYKPKKFVDTYAVRLIDYTAELDTKLEKPKYPENKVRVCRTCIKKMGYKVKVTKPKAK